MLVLAAIITCVSCRRSTSESTATPTVVAGASDRAGCLGRLFCRLASRPASPCPTQKKAQQRPEEAPEASVEAKPLPPFPTPSMAEKNPLAGCQMCHVDIEDEYLGSMHYEQMVACVDCHGPSTGHLADENNEVKPDERFARADVDGICNVCHDCPRDVTPEEKAQPKARRPVCIDCHGPHDQAWLAAPIPRA